MFTQNCDTTMSWMKKFTILLCNSAVWAIILIGAILVQVMACRLISSKLLLNLIISNGTKQYTPPNNKYTGGEWMAPTPTHGDEFPPPLNAGQCHHPFNTLRPRQNGRRFADITFKRIFLNENVRISIKISLKFVPKGPINNNPALVQIMAWRRPGDKPLSEPMLVSLLTHLCVTRPQWVKCVIKLSRTRQTLLFV